MVDTLGEFDKPSVPVDRLKTMEIETFKSLHGDYIKSLSVLIPEAPGEEKEHALAAYIKLGFITSILDDIRNGTSIIALDDRRLPNDQTQWDQIKAKNILVFQESHEKEDKLLRNGREEAILFLLDFLALPDDKGRLNHEYLRWENAEKHIGAKVINKSGKREARLPTVIKHMELVCSYGVDQEFPQFSLAVIPQKP